MGYKESIFKDEAIGYRGKEKADIRFFDGALRHAIGIKHYQVVMADRERPETQEDYGWTYNHAPMICFWNRHFFVEYLSNKVSEHEPPSHTLLTWSKDGKEWTKPIVVFPQYILPEGVYTGPKKELLKKGDTAIMHQRMGFYVSKDGRLLVLGFYGVSPEVHTNPNNGYGIARVVREVYKDFTFSPVYVIKYNRFGGFDECNVEFPFYMESMDDGFKKACKELLSNKPVTRQWWEEERFDTKFFAQPGGSAFCYYSIDDKKVIGLHKNAFVTVSEDGGQTWGEFKKCPSIETSTGKIWGEKVGDARYCLVYNPTTDSMHRWPLAVATGSDGQSFYDLLALTLHVPPSRYAGWAKNLGPQYVRGICEGYPKPSDGCMWLTYSMNKEDIWICKLPLPVRGTEAQPIEGELENGDISNWNIHSPKWANVDISEKGLLIKDSVPYDKAIAERVFIESLAVTVEVGIIPLVAGKSGLYIDLTDKKGAAAVRILFKQDMAIYIKSNGVYNKVAYYDTNKRYVLHVKADCVLNAFCVRITCHGVEILNNSYKFNLSVDSLERFVLQTKDRVNFYDLESNGKDGSMKDLHNLSTSWKAAEFCITEFRTRDHISEDR